MGDFMQHAAGVMKKYADKIALLDENRAMTYGELDEASGKIYGWLKKQGIGREDFVQLVMPRGVTGLAAMLGVWKAGAAFVISEQDYPAHRIEFIRQDMGAQVVIDEKTYQRIMAEEAMLDGFQETDSHDAALAIYTSGSTGNPKGILHEYGNLDLIALYDERQQEYHEEPVALVAPFSFVITIIYTVNCFNHLRPLLIVSAELLRDFAGLQAFFREKKVYNLFVTPSYLRMYKDPSPYLDYIVIGGENTSGIYYEGGKPRVRVLYSLSEAGFYVLQKDLDRSYDNAPLGKPVIASLDVHLEDEEGNRIEGPGEGEICFKNIYMREYMHLPEKTAETFRGGYFHTGDLARRDADGMYYYIGRSDDMFKINGNRVEPGEIESAFRKVTGLSTVMAKCFEEKGRSYICMYYLRGEAEATGILQAGELTVSLAQLADILPRYMLPTYYIPLEKMPVNDHGKIVRRLLEPPKVEAEQQAYAAPASEMESIICQLMSEVLGLDCIGATHDFYLMGGDSLRTIRLVALAGERGYALKAGDIYAARTPRKLARLLEKGSGTSPETLRKLAEIRQHFAGDYQQYLATGELDSYTGSFFTRNKDEVMSAAAGINFKFTLREEVDGERLERAVRKAVQACPYVAFGLEFHENVPRLTFKRLDDMIPLFQGYLPQRFDEPELQGHFAFASYRGGELTLCVCHAITDGHGFMKFMQALLEAYGGKEVSFQASKDCCADVMKYEWPLPETFKPEEADSKEIFEVKETQGNEGSLCRDFLIDRQSFEACRGKMGLSPQSLSAYILARALQLAALDNDKTIRIRCPIDTRDILGVKETFQNASVPHMYLDFYPDKLLPGLPREEAERISASFYRQLSYEHIAHETNVLAGAAKGDAAEFTKVILDYVGRSNLCVSYIGGATGADMSEAVVKMEPAYKGQPPFPVMLYFWEMGEKISVQYAQGFAGEDYVAAIRETFKELGIEIV
ncbi:non-ribosomal peptide synthetase [Selenomonas sp. KH1T6]|uniref:non-ribosomal peptide synthetase n=1 Tax=Selenomonas sp. KH1T6 TaxID=3158784 RepID=UPI0008A72DB7|nr:Acyl-CoA synthetase (AMP-forming)/AMP-acid ligase II [Selenomonas ruminantium]